MRVLVRDCQTGFYYAGPKRWVPDPCRATDFQEVERATELKEARGTEAEIVLDYAEPGLRSRYRADPGRRERTEERDGWLISASATSL